MSSAMSCQICELFMIVETILSNEKNKITNCVAVGLKIWEWPIEEGFVMGYFGEKAEEFIK